MAAWDDIIGDPEFQAQPPEVKTRVADNFFAENIGSDIEFQLQPEDVKEQVRTNFFSTIQPPEDISKPGRGVERTLAGTAKDIGIAALSGAIALPEALVGIADIPTGGRVGKFLEEKVGFKPAEAREILAEELSPAQKEAQRKVGEAEGFLPTVGAALESPSTIVQAAIESAPSILGGAGIARGILKAAPKISSLIAAAAGEGAITAGALAEDIRGRGKSGLLTPKQSGAAAAAGVVTGIFGLAGGRVAQKLGIGDIDTFLAKQTGKPTKKGVVRRVLEGGFTEGAFEELPQSAQEQIWQNAAENKPLLEGVDKASAMGLLTGASIGGGFNVFRTGTTADTEESQGNIAESYVGSLVGDGTLTQEQGDSIIAGFDERSTPESTPEDNVQIMSELLDEFAPQEEVIEEAEIVPEEVAEEIIPPAEVIEDPIDATTEQVRTQAAEILDTIEPTTDMGQQVKELLQEEVAKVTPVAEEVLPEAEVVAPVTPEVALEPPLPEVAPVVPERPPTPEPPIKINIREGVAELDDQNRQVLEAIKSEVEAGEAGRRVPVRTEEGEVLGMAAESSTFPDFFQSRGFKKKAVLSALNKALGGKKLAPGQERNIRELHEAFQRFRPEQIAQLEDIETIQASTLRKGDSFNFEGDTITVRGIGDDGILTLFDQDNNPATLLPDEEIDIDRGTLKKAEAAPEAKIEEKEAPEAPERVRIGKSPQAHEVIRELDQTPEEKELGERFFEIRNEKTKEVQTVEFAEMKPIKKRKKAVFKLGDDEALGDPTYEDVNNTIVNLDVSLDPQLPTYENSAAIKEQALRPNQKDRQLLKIKRDDLKRLVAETGKERGETNVGPVKIYRALYARDFDFGEEGYLSPNPDNPHDTPTGTPVIATWWMADPEAVIEVGGFKDVQKERGQVEIVVMDIDSMPDEIYVVNSTESGDLSDVWIANPFHTPENNISRHSLTNFEKAYSINFKEGHNANAIKQGESVSSSELQGVEGIYGSGAQQENQARVEEQARVPGVVKERPTKRPEALGVQREERPTRRRLVRKKPALKIEKAVPSADKVQLKKDISKTIRSITKGWKNSPPVKVVATTEQIPAEIQEDIKLSKADGKVKGLLDPNTGTIYLISDNIKSTEEAERVFFHESLGHVGIRTLLGKDINPVLNKVYKKYQAEANDIANTYGFDVTTKEGQREAAEEVLANIAEENSDPGLLKRAYATIRKWLRKIGFNIDLSDNDIRSMMADAAQVVKRPDKSLSLSGPVVFSRKIDPPSKRIEDLRKKFGAGPLPQKAAEDVYGTSVKDIESAVKEEADVVSGAPETKTYREDSKGVYKGFVERVTKTFDKLDPLGSLPEKASYLKTRNLTLGKLAKISDTSKQIYNAFSKATPEQAKIVYEFLTNADIKPTSIKNKQQRADAVEVKRAIIKTGEDLVSRGLLDKQTFMSMKGAYLPRIYLKHLLPENEFIAMGEGKKPSDMGWSKKRKDIPEDVRRLILGEITDPGYLASKGFGQQQRDMAMLDWLEVVSKNKQWTLDQSLVKWNGQKVTPFWLKNEADRIRRQSKLYLEQDRKEAMEISNKMSDIADEALLNRSGVPKNFKQIPDTPRYGALRGMIVRKEIFDDIVGASNVHLGDASIAEKILGNGGVATKFTQLWKWSKVAANPPGQIRNFVSNGILLHLSGVPFHKVPLRVVEAVSSIRKNGEAWKVAKKHGVTQSTFSSQELVRIERELLDIEARRSGPVSLATFKNIAGRIIDLTGDMYQLSESIFKTAKIIDEMKKGRAPEDAALEAQKWLFDYSLVTPSMKYLRNAPIGVPFLTFYLKALPRMLEVLLTNPIKFAPYAAIPYALTALISNMTDADDEDVDKLRKALPKWLEERGNAYILPAKDAQGRWQAIDVGYFLPWATWTDMAADAGRGEFADAFRGTGIFSGPLPDMITAIKTNIDPFTKRPIINEFDPPEKKIASMMGYLYQMSAPTWLTNIGFAGHMYRAVSGAVDKYGDPKTNEFQAALRLVGVNLYPIDPIRTRNQNIRWMNFEISQVKRRRSQLLKDKNFTPKERKSIRQEYKEMIDKRREELRRYKVESEVVPQLR
jgi:hypothetical protein